MVSCEEVFFISAALHCILRGIGLADKVPPYLTEHTKCIVLISGSHCRDTKEIGDAVGEASELRLHGSQRWPWGDQRSREREFSWVLNGAKCLDERLSSLK